MNLAVGQVQNPGQKNAACAVVTRIVEIRDLGQIMIPNSLTLEKKNSINSENVLKNKCEDSRKTEFVIT